MHPNDKMLTYIKKTDAIIFGDNTLWRSDITSKLCEKMALNSAINLKFNRSLNLFYAAYKARRILRADPESNIEAMMMQYRAMSMADISRKEMFKRMICYMRRNSSAEVSHIAEESENKKIIATLSGSTIARGAMRVHRIDWRISNRDIFKAGIVAGIHIKISDGEDKLNKVERKLYKHKMLLRNCTVIGGDATDIPLMMEAEISIASPHATHEVKSIASAQMEYYGKDFYRYDPFEIYNSHAIE